MKYSKLDALSFGNPALAAKLVRILGCEAIHQLHGLGGVRVRDEMCRDEALYQLPVKMGARIASPDSLEMARELEVCKTIRIVMRVHVYLYVHVYAHAYASVYKWKSKPYC